MPAARGQSRRPVNRSSSEMYQFLLSGSSACRRASGGALPERPRAESSRRRHAAAAKYGSGSGEPTWMASSCDWQGPLGGTAEGAAGELARAESVAATAVPGLEEVFF